MTNTIKCKNCGVEIEISEALSHQIEEQVLATIKIDHVRELEEVKKKAEEESSKKALEKFEIQIASLQKEKDEEKTRNKELAKQLSELLDEMRKLQRKDEEREIEFKKKIMEEETKIKEETAKKVEEEHRLKDLEKDKRLQDSLKQVEELKTKMQQGSQQTQGEVLELELEEKLKKEFQTDSINEIGKGVRGGDITQLVIDKNGQQCGSILWESKNAQWSDKWIAKLREDQRLVKADLGVLVSVNLPSEIMTFIYRDGVWICSRQMAVALAYALRYNLVQAKYLRTVQDGKKGKMEGLYSYLSGVEFRQRVEALVEGFSEMQKEQENEKRWFALKWARQEKSLRKLVDQTHGMYGDMQGIIGSALPQIGVLETGIEEEKIV